MLSFLLFEEHLLKTTVSRCFGKYEACLEMQQCVCEQPLKIYISSGNEQTWCWELQMVYDSWAALKQIVSFGLFMGFVGKMEM